MTAPETVRSLDHLGALAAHWVLGWELCDKPNECGGCACRVRKTSSGNWMVRADDNDRFIHLAEDIGDAWRLVDKLAEDGWQLDLKDYTRPWWRACFAHPFSKDTYHLAASASAAICLAALDAVGHPVRLELGAGEEG